MRGDHGLLRFARNDMASTEYDSAISRRDAPELLMTTSPKEERAPVVCTLCSLTDQSPPCEHDHAPDAAASTASRPNVRDDGQRPSTGTGWREL